jgi:hypothetical protein
VTLTFANSSKTSRLTGNEQVTVGFAVKTGKQAAVAFSGMRRANEVLEKAKRLYRRPSDHGGGCGARPTLAQRQ